MKRPASAGPSSHDTTEKSFSCGSAERPSSAMRRFFPSDASTNLGSVGQPATVSDTGSTAASSNSGIVERSVNVSARSSSAEQLATPCHLQLTSIRDVQFWLAKEPIRSFDSADTERIRALIAVLLRAKPRQQDLRPFHSEWQVAHHQKKIPRLLPEVIQEFESKVIKAAQKVQQKLLDSAEQPASSTTVVEQSASMDTTDAMDSDHDAMRAKIRVRVKRRAQDIAADEQQPVAKAKAFKGCNKRPAAASVDSVQRPAARKKERLLTAELFALGTGTPSEPSAASVDSAVQSTPVQQQRQMKRLLYELSEVVSLAWIVGDSDVRRKAMIALAFDLRNIPPTQKILRKRSISALYSRICGVMHPFKEELYQDRTHVCLTACYEVERQARQFVQAIEEIDESRSGAYPCLWELKNRQNDVVLNGLPDMPKSPHELFESLLDTEASASIPFGRLPLGKHAELPFLKCPEYFVRMLACLQLPNRQFVDLPIP